MKVCEFISLDDVRLCPRTFGDQRGISCRGLRGGGMINVREDANTLAEVKALLPAERAP